MYHYIFHSLHVSKYSYKFNFTAFMSLEKLNQAQFILSETDQIALQIMTWPSFVVLLHDLVVLLSGFSRVQVHVLLVLG